MSAPNRKSRSSRATPGKLALPLAAVAPLLASCGGSEQDKAAAEVARAASEVGKAVEGIGLHGLSWSKARKDGDTFSFLDAKADLDGVGPVHASGLTVSNFRKSDGGWRADSMVADAVDGSARARRISVRGPWARQEAGSWSSGDDGRVVEGYEGPLRGVPVIVRSASAGPAQGMAGRPGAAQAAASGLRLRDGAPGRLAALQGLDWEVSVRSESARPGAAFVEVQRAEAAGWSLRGRLDLAGGPGLTATLARMAPADLLDPGRWPEGVLLREADLDMTLARPGDFIGTTAPDPVAGSLAAKVAAGGPVSWHVRMQPREPVAVRALPGILAKPGADDRLGLTAQARDIVRPGMAAQPQAPAGPRTPVEVPGGAQPGPATPQPGQGAARR